MKEIYLTNGMVVFVDKEDFEDLNQYQWRAMLTRREGKFYAVRTVKIDGHWTTELMHRRLVGIDGLDVDHFDGNGLNNQRCNLRICTRSQNLGNRTACQNNVLRLKGVRKHNLSKKFQAQITFKRKAIYLGLFDTPEEASQAYNTKAKELFGEFAKLNLV